MPCLNVKVSCEPSPQLAEAIATRLTRLTAELLGKKPEVTAVLVEPVPADRWFINGSSLEASATNSFYLDIKITEGTNTKQEKATYCRQVFAAMRELLREIDEASYIVIHDVRADSWGYQGMTQEYRFIKASNL